ncbi:SPOSA6832_02937, partial [Sporobolomyces salmonicolor]
MPALRWRTLARRKGRHFPSPARLPPLLLSAGRIIEDRTAVKHVVPPPRLHAQFRAQPLPHPPHRKRRLDESRRLFRPDACAVLNFPLRPTLRSSAPDMTKIKLENPIPGLEKELPKGARLERGGATAERSHGQTKDAEVSVAALVKRVAADQLGMAPVSLVIFLVSMSMLEGLDGEEMREKIRQNYMPILLVNWQVRWNFFSVPNCRFTDPATCSRQVWPILQLINFRYVPLKCVETGFLPLHAFLTFTPLAGTASPSARVRFPVSGFFLPLADASHLTVCGIAWTAFLSFRTAKPSSD